MVVGSMIPATPSTPRQSGLCNHDGGDDLPRWQVHSAPFDLLLSQTLLTHFMDVERSLSEAGYLVATLEMAVLFITQVQQYLVCSTVDSEDPKGALWVFIVSFLLESYYMSLSMAKCVIPRLKDMCAILCLRIRRRRLPFLYTFVSPAYSPMTTIDLCFHDWGCCYTSHTHTLSSSPIISTDTFANIYLETPDAFVSCSID